MTYFFLQLYFAYQFLSIFKISSCKQRLKTRKGLILKGVCYNFIRARQFNVYDKHNNYLQQIEMWAISIKMYWKGGHIYLCERLL